MLIPPNKRQRKKVVRNYTSLTVFVETGERIRSKAKKLGYSISEYVDRLSKL